MKKTNRIKEEEVTMLKNAEMTFPTLKYFNQSLFVQNIDLNRSFGNKPLSHEDNKFLETEIKSGIQVGQGIIGIDIPVLLKPSDKNGKTIIIVGESPLRVVPKENEEKNIQIGTPYAVHQKFRYPPQCNVYKKIFAALLEKGYTLYLTDAIKIWWDGKELNSNETDATIFRREIDEIKKTYEDVKMIAWGKKAAKLLKSMGYKENEAFYRTLHPSRQSWAHWRTQIINKAIYDKNDIQYILDRYPKKDSKTTEIIVAEEAISDILSCINRE